MNNIQASIKGKKLDSILPMINKAFNRAIEVSTKEFKTINHGNDIIINFKYSKDTNKIFAKDGVGGYTTHSGLIDVYINPENATESSIYSVICHELSHAKRWTERPNHDNRLIEAVIFEGLGIAFENESMSKGESVEVLNIINNRKGTIKLLNKMKSEFLIHNFDWNKNYDRYFKDGDNKENIPAWAAYEVGYYLVKKKMKQTGKRASQLIALAPDEFI